MINPIRKKRCKIIRKFIKIIITKRLDRLSSFAKLASGQWPLAICTGYADFAKKKNTSKLLIIIFIKTKLCICARNETRICFSSRHYYYLLFRFLFFVVLTLFCTNWNKQKRIMVLNSSCMWWFDWRWCRRWKVGRVCLKVAVAIHSSLLLVCAHSYIFRSSICMQALIWHVFGDLWNNCRRRRRCSRVHLGFECNLYASFLLFIQFFHRLIERSDMTMGNLSVWARAHHIFHNFVWNEFVKSGTSCLSTRASIRALKSDINGVKILRFGAAIVVVRVPIHHRRR